jgi:spore coat polysaccharide biosynthesis protein SpsF
VKLGNIGVVVAARMLSSRLPGKALLPLQGIPMILFLLRRLSPLDGGTVILATTTLPSDDRMAELAQEAGIPVFRGSDDDVVGRYVAVAEKYEFDTVARVTGDCPFVDANLVNWCLAEAQGFDSFDLATTKGRFPVGLDVEIYPTAVMARLHKGGVLSATDREHLTFHFYQHANDFKVRIIEPRREWRAADRRFTVDTEADYEAARVLAAHFASPEFSVGDLVAKAA